MVREAAKKVFFCGPADEKKKRKPDPDPRNPGSSSDKNRIWIRQKNTALIFYSIKNSIFYKLKIHRELTFSTLKPETHDFT